MHPDTRPPGAIGSLSLGERTVFLFPRDVEALQANPLTMSLAFGPGGHDKLDRMQRFGEEQTFTHDEVTVLHNPLAALMPQFGKTGQFEIKFGRRRLGRILRAKCEAIGKDEVVAFDYLEFHDEKVGSEEIVLVSNDAGHGFMIRLVLRSSFAGAGTITFLYSLPGTYVSAALKLFKALRIVKHGGQFRLTDLETGKHVKADLSYAGTDANWETEVIRFLEKLDRIAQYFDIKLQLPTSLISESDLEMINILECLCSGGTISINRISVNLVKSEDNKDLVVNSARGAQELSLIFQAHDYKPAPVIFGRPVDIGWVEVSGERLVIQNGTQTVKLFEEAEIGAAVPMEFEVRGNASLRLIKHPWPTSPKST